MVLPDTLARLLVFVAIARGGWHTEATREVASTTKVAGKGETVLVKTILSTLSDAQAHKELGQYTMYAWPGVVIGYFILTWLGALGVFFGARAFVLTFHAGNKGRSRLLLYRIFTGLVTLFGAFEVMWFWVHV